MTSGSSPHPLTAYKKSVFVNVPFDPDYKPKLDAIIFTIFDCGFVPRSALESDDAARVRIDKIYDLIDQSKYGIHDISRTELDSINGLPRFNMPLELGVFLGAKRFGPDLHKNKCALILDWDRYRFQKFCSDIAGQDIRAHSNDIETTIGCVRDWLRASPDAHDKMLPGTKNIYRRYLNFCEQLPQLCQELDLEVESLSYVDYTYLVSGWLQTHPR